MNKGKIAHLHKNKAKEKELCMYCSSCVLDVSL